MAAFEVAALLVVLAGVGGIAWLAVPGLLQSREEPEEDPAFTEGDVEERLAALVDRACVDEAPVIWSSRPLEPGHERLPSSLGPVDGLFLVGGDEPALLPLNRAFLRANTREDRLRGRRQGRPVDAVRLADDLYLDLYEALRILPIVGIELEARGLPTTVDHIAPGRPLPSATALPIAPWLVSGVGPRVITGAEVRRTFVFTLLGTEVVVEVWMPAVEEGLRLDTLAWAGRIQVGEHTSTGATPAPLLAHLGMEATPSLGWTRTELLELAAILEQLERQEVDISPFLLEVFADHEAPKPDPHDESAYLVTSALLNWAGAAHRRAGRPRTALGLIDIALTTASPVDDDNRADLHFNRGLALLDLRDQDPEALQRALDAFTLSARLTPGDAAPWVQSALVHHLREAPEQARDAWLQAATRTHDEDDRAILLANARSIGGG